MNANLLQTEVSLVWEIRNCFYYFKRSQYILRSPPFLVKCTEVVSLSLALRYYGETIDCILYRLNHVDDLGDIHVKCSIFIIGPDESMTLLKMHSGILSKETRSLEMLDLNCSLIQAEHVVYQTIRLQFNLEVSANSNETTSWNCNEGLKALSRDMQKLLNHSWYGDQYLPTDDLNIFVHSFVMAARCPNLKRFDLVKNRSRQSPNNQPRIYPGLQSLTAPLALPPKSNFVKRSDGLYSMTDKKPLDIDDMDFWLGFLRYLYCGRVNIGFDEPLTDDLKFELLRAARYYNLTDLVYKLQEVANKTTFVTELNNEHSALDFDLIFSKGTLRYPEPVTHLVSLSTDDTLYMSVTLSVTVEESRNLMHLSFQLLENSLPIAVRVGVVFFRNSYSTTPIKTIDSIILIHESSWSPSFELDANDNILVRCMFSLFSKERVEVTRQEFSLSPNDFIEPRSLRQLSYDFATAFMRQEGNADFTLIAQQEEHKVHKQILCCRVPRLLKDNEGGNLKLLDCESKTLENLIEYIYTGMLLERYPANIEKLLEFSRNLNLPELINACEAHLKKSLDMH